MRRYGSRQFNRTMRYYFRNEIWKNDHGQYDMSGLDFFVIVFGGVLIALMCLLNPLNLIVLIPAVVIYKIMKKKQEGCED